MRARVVLLITILLFAPLSAFAQTSVALIADRVEIISQGIIIASGNVEVLQGTTKLRASRITYNQTTNQLDLDGPLTIIDESGSVIVAESAALSTDLRNGIIRSARLVMNDQLQIAAAEINRVDGRYTQLQKTVASSCRVCSDKGTPLWQIRARRIVHDAETRQIYFDQARFEVAGVPILYLPRLRLPDPTLKRTSGFLFPTIRSTDNLGTGIKVPYFLALGDDKDLTITPYWSSARTETVELRYRQAFRNGYFEANGALSRDDLVPGTIRKYLFADGAFDLANDFKLKFDIEAVSDNAYLSDYSYSYKDRLDSALEVSRVKRDQIILAEVINYNSLRDSDINSQLPTIQTNLSYERRFSPKFLGGTGGFKFETHGHYRSSGSDMLGRDVARATASVDWRRNWRLLNGMQVAARSELAFDYYSIADDSSFDDTVLRATGSAAVELRWPLLKTERGGATQILQPIMQLAWSGDNGANVPNDDSVIVEFDEGNLFSFSRFPGADAHETGLRANLGFQWTRFTQNDWSISIAGGRVVRQKDLGEFNEGTGLTGTSSDWMASAQLKFGESFSLANRALFDDNFDLTKNELRAEYFTKKFDVAGSFVWLDANPSEERLQTSSEAILDATYRFGRHWQGSFDVRYDFAGERTNQIGAGVAYRNECVALDVSVARRFTSSTSVRPTTDFGLSLTLSGFGNGSDGSAYRRKCNG